MDEIMTNTEVEQTTEVQEPVVEAQEVQETPVEEKPVQPRSVNQQFKAQRRENERQQLAAAQAENKRLMEALGHFGYQGTADDIIVALEAQRKGISPEEYRSQQEQDAARYKEAMQNDPEYLELKAKADQFEQMAFENVFKEDLAAIKKAFPDVKAKTVDDLGMQFTALRANGVDAVTAYAAVQKGIEATKKPVPPVMGALNKTPAEKEFYTSEEIDNLTDKQLDDPAIWARVMRSLPRLGRNGG